MANLILRGLLTVGRHGMQTARSTKHVKQLGAVTLTLNESILSEQRRWRPVCTVDTNVETEKIDPHFLTGLSSLIAETLNKPEKLISIALRTNVRVCRNGNESASAVVHIWSIGVFDEERNPGYSKIFIDYMSGKLGVPTDRITLFLHPVSKTDAGHLLYMEQ